MAKQFQQLSATQRQDLAVGARAAETNDAQQMQDASSTSSQDNTAADQHARAADTASANRRQTQEQARDDDSETNPQTTPARPRSRTSSAKPLEDTPPAWMQQTTQKAAMPAEDQAWTNTSGTAQGHNSLRTIELSPQVRIITDPGKAPSPESLTAFAKAMGLDESAIQKLMGATDAQPAGQATVDVNAMTSSATSAPSLPGASNALLAALQAHTDAHNPLGVQTPSANTASLSGTDLTVTLAPVQTNVEAMTALNQQVGASMNGPLMPMSAAEMASIQQIQITVLPAAVLPVGTSNAVAQSTPSTLDVLSLLGGGTQETDISALASAFSQGEAGENGNPSQGQSSDNSNTGGFAQALTRHNAANAAAPNASTQATSSTHMSEVYDQLSDKLATEMAARMHKQLSDGEWKMKFGLRPANLGGVEIQLEMKDGKLDAVFRADNALTRDLLQNSSQRLRDALENFGIQAGQVQIGQQPHQQQQNPQHGSAKQPQVGDNSPLQVSASTDSTPVAARNKANASLLDLYA
jgi:flagellar hook-length control protein FliK